jgi:NAD(P)-dependent dehydrogenase (short-subunit alcohol dehydrogenase family)
MIDYCVLTGAGSGIGRATALRLAQRQIPVLLVGRPATVGKTRDAIVSAGGEAEVFACDLERYEKNWAKLLKRASSLSGRRWGLVLAGAILGPNNGGLAAYEKVFRTNVLGNLAILEACLPQMRKNGYGRTVFFAGGGAGYAYPRFPGYALSKVSTVRLVENLAATYPPKTGLSFICVAPGAVETPMLAKVLAARGEVKTRTSINEPVAFIERYFESSSTSISGRYLHVRDDWQPFFDGTKLPAKDQFYLRRIT